MFNDMKGNKRSKRLKNVLEKLNQIMNIELK